MTACPSSRVAHAIRFGIDFLYNDDTITFPRTIRGSYSFSSLANFLNGVYNNSGYTQTFGVTQVHQTNPNIGFYAQDEYKVRRSLTLNVGLRYDLEFLQDRSPPRPGMFRRGLDSRGRHLFRVAPWCAEATGCIYDRIPLRPLANALLSAGNTTVVNSLQQLSISLSPTQAGAPAFPGIFGSLTIPAGVLFNFSTMDPNMKNAYSEQGSFEDRAAGGTERDAQRRISARARAASDYFGESECAVVHRRGHQRWLPSESDFRQRQPVFFARRFALRRRACVVRPAAGEVGQLPRVLYLFESSGQRGRILLQRARSTISTSGRIMGGRTTISAAASRLKAPYIPPWRERIRRGRI